MHVDEYEIAIDFVKYILALPDDTMPTNAKLKFAEKLFQINSEEISLILDNMLTDCWTLLGQQKRI